MRGQRRTRETISTRLTADDLAAAKTLAHDMDAPRVISRARNALDEVREDSTPSERTGP